MLCVFVVCIRRFISQRPLKASPPAATETSATILEVTAASSRTTRDALPVEASTQPLASPAGLRRFPAAAEKTTFGGGFRLGNKFADKFPVPGLDAPADFSGENCWQH